MTHTREAMTATLSRFSREVVPLFLVIDCTARLFHAMFGLQRPWLLLVFAAAWMLTGASALSNHRRGSYVPWSSCTARPFQTLCLFALNTAPWLAVGLLQSPSTSSLALSAEIPGWICGLGAALAIAVAAWPMRRQRANAVLLPASTVQDSPAT